MLILLEIAFRLFKGLKILTILKDFKLNVPAEISIILLSIKIKKLTQKLQL
jgi:hypothetical protein